MSEIVLDQQLLMSLKQEAKRKTRQDPSQTYIQWLDTLSSPDGYTYKSLKRQVAKLEQQARDQALADEEGLWVKRFEKPMVWGKHCRQRRNRYQRVVAAAGYTWSRRVAQLLCRMGYEVQWNGYAKLSITVLMESGWLWKAAV